MSKINKKSGRFISPGERLGVIEEFLPGQGTFIENGVIYASIVGMLLNDQLNKKVWNTNIYE